MKHLPGAEHNTGTWFSLDQESRSDRPRVAREARADCGVSDADGAGLAVYSVLQRQVRLYLRTHDQQLPGNKGLTAIPTAAVVLALFAQVALVQLWIDEQEVAQLSGVQPHHRLVCEALGLDSSWYAVPSAQKNGRDIRSLSRGVATPTRVQNRT